MMLRMKKGDVLMSKLASVLIGAAVVAGAAAVYAIAPAKAEQEKKAPFLGRYFAHRGLHNTDGSAPENSLPAFRLAAEMGYGIELDVHLTKDNQVIVFHDDDLLRMCGVDAKTEDFTYEELLQLRLAGTEHHIPLFTEVMEVYAGAGPMVLELKTSPRKYELCEHTYALLKGYEGDVCIESFDPRIVGWWKKNAPEYIRGQLAQPMEFYEEQSKPLAFMLANCLTNFMARPHFVAYKLGKKPLGVRIAEAMGAMKFSWTSKSLLDKQGQDGIIFEHYNPDLYL